MSLQINLPVKIFGMANRLGPGQLHYAQVIAFVMSKPATFYLNWSHVDGIYIFSNVDSHVYKKLSCSPQLLNLDCS